jgi:hypothetical protein
VEFGGVTAAGSALGETVREIETRFLEISSAVESTTDISRRLVEHADALAAITHGPNGGESGIAAAAGRIWRSIEFVERSIEENDALVARLTATREQLSQALVTEQELARTLAPIRFVQSLFRVESARLAPELQAMFHAIVTEIERVRVNVESEFQTKFELIREVRGILDHAIAQLNQRGISAKKSVAVLRSQLTASLQRMQETYDQNRGRNARLLAVSKVIATETGRVVLSLQFCDTFTQKLQHTQKILGEMQERLSALPAGAADATRALRFLEQSGLICGAQLTAMQAEFVQSGDTLCTGIAGIAREMSALDEDRTALRDLDARQGGFGGAVQILLESLGDVQRLVGAAERFALESHQAIAPIGNKTTNFTQFIGNLAFEIQLIGLNSEIQATHVGQGTGLEVLSAQTSSISRETSALSLRLASDFDALTSGLAVIVTAFEGIRQRSVAFHQNLTAEATADTAALGAYRDQSVATLREIGALLPQLQAKIESALARSELVSVANPPLAQLEKSLAGFVAAAKRAADQTGIEVEAGGLTDHFLSYYTMAAEGAVHRRVLGQPEPVEVRPAPLVGEIDLFDSAPAVPAGTDVELFGEPASLESPAAQAPAVAPEVAAGDVDLWLDEPEPAAPSAAQKPNDREERSAA